VQYVAGSSLQLHGIGDLDEYFSDSSAMAIRIYISRLIREIETVIITNISPQPPKTDPTRANMRNLDVSG
jgi:hypothetical protein